MNAAQAKQIDFPSLLEILGYHQQMHVTQQGLWYLSPWREEKTPSFKVWQLSTGLWCFKDFGSGEGGNIIAFANRMIGKETSEKSISEALTWLESTYGGRVGLPAKYPAQASNLAPPEAFETGLELITEKAISNPALLSYAAGRKITETVLRKYCREIHFKGRSDKKLFGIGIRNDSGGWEVRAAIGSFKAVVGSDKDISIVYGSDSDPDTLHVFEGAFDFLSKETFIPLADNEADMILNSANLIEKAIHKIQAETRLRNVKFIRLWLQNDAMGKKTLNRFCEAFETGYSVGDMSPNYADYKDLNKSLIENPAQWRPVIVQKMYHDTAWNQIMNAKPSIK